MAIIIENISFQFELQLITRTISGVIKTRTVNYKNRSISKFYKSEEQCGIP